MQAIGNNFYARGRNKINDELYDESEKTNKHFSDLVSVLNNIKNDLNTKLNAYEITQRNLYDNYKQILSMGGNPKMNKAVRRILNREKIHIDEDNLDELNYLEGKTMDYVNSKAMEATIAAHVDGGVPNIVINIGKLDEETIGHLIYFFELACAMSGNLLEVNPFNQPGVEKYKTNMFRLLGKPGYEE